MEDLVDGVRDFLGAAFSPTEQRLWHTIAIVLGASLLLLFGSFQMPWYASDYYPAGNVEVDSDYHFDEAHVRLYTNGALGQERYFVYGENSAFEDLMSFTNAVLGFGTAMVIAFAAALVAYHRGYLEQVSWIIGAWAVGLGALVMGIAYFSARVASTAVAEITRLANENDIFVSPAQPVFWGTQRLPSGTLATNPGPGWILAMLAVINLVVALVLLFQFPDVDPEGDHVDDYELEATDSAPSTGLAVNERGA